MELRLEPVESVQTLRAAWGDLAARSCNVFGTPEFHDLWWRHFGAGRELRISSVHDGSGAVRAIIPLYVWRARPLRVVRLLGHFVGDELGPVGAAADVAAAAALLPQALGSFDVFIGEQLPESLPVQGSTLLSREGSPVISFADRTWDDYLGGRSRNFREQVRRRERKLFRERDCSYRLATKETLADDLETLFRLHSTRWRADTAFAQRVSFHREWAALAEDRGWLRLWLLEVDGKPRAAWYGLRFGGVESYYQAGRDRELDGLSIGFVLLSHTIRSAAADGMREYRFLRGGEEYKYRFADEDPGLKTVGLTRGPLGAAALRALRAGKAVTRWW